MKKICVLSLLLFIPFLALPSGIKKEIERTARVIDSLTTVVKEEAIVFSGSRNFASEEESIKAFVNSSSNLQLLINNYQKIYGLLNKRTGLYRKFKIERKTLETFTNHKDFVQDLPVVAFLAYLESGRHEIKTILE